MLLLFTISFMTIGYSSSLNSLLESIGYISFNSSVGNLEIIRIDTISSTNATSKDTNFYISSESTDGKSILVAEFAIDYYRAQGSDITSMVYDVTIKNRSLKSRTLTAVSSNPTFENNTTGLNYTMSGGYIGTTVLEPGEEVTVTLKFSLSQSNRNTTYTVNEIFKFEFSDEDSDSFRLKPILGTTSLEFSNASALEKISIAVINNSLYDATYTFSVDNSNFELVDINGNKLESYSIDASSSSSLDVYMKIASNHIFDSLTDSVSIHLNTTSPSVLNYDLGSISVAVFSTGAQKIISSETVYDDTTIDFTTISSQSGLYKNISSDGVTYFYRGNVSNNYVSFAGFTWRIVKMDKYGTRVILDSFIDSFSSWGTNPGVGSNVDTAIEILTYDNTSVKTIVENWYTNNLSSYATAIKPSLFCLDTSYQTMTSSGNAGVTVYYFGSYIRNGQDSAGYTPNFSCGSEYIREYNIGLLSGDEVAFAGGLFNSSNPNYYLYNRSLTSGWWTLSPSYYDSSLGSVGMLVVDGSSGKFYDWPNSSTIENSFGIRPVITIDTDKLTGGSGVVGDEYTFGL